MGDRDALLAELKDSREHAAALLRAKLEAMAGQVQDLSSRLVREIQTVLPPDLEVLFPLTQVGASLEELEHEVARRVEASRPAPPPAPVAPTTAPIQLQVLRQLEGGKAQSEVLQELLRQVGAWCGPRAIVVFKETQAAGWAGAGFQGADPVRTWRGAVGESPALTKVLDKTPVLLPVAGDALLSEWFGGRTGKLLLVPMMLRGKVVGALLAAEGEAGLDTTMVQLVTFLVGLLLETLTVRTVVPSPTLLDPLDLTADLTPPAEVAAEEPVVFGEAEEHVPVEDHTVPPGSLPTMADTGATMQLKTPIAVAPAPVAAAAVPVPTPPVRPVPPVAPPAPPAPPARSPEEQRKHDEARRFARLLVSEIRLYNEQIVQEGKQTRDIYRRLKEDIDRSQEMYEQRIPADIRASSNYFYDELVRILADGDPNALGL